MSERNIFEELRQGLLEMQEMTEYQEKLREDAKQRRKRDEAHTRSSEE